MLKGFRDFLLKGDLITAAVTAGGAPLPGLHRGGDPGDGLRAPAGGAASRD
jgi:hypothetical protein